VVGGFLLPLDHREHAEGEPLFVLGRIRQSPRVGKGGCFLGIFLCRCPLFAIDVDVVVLDHHVFAVISLFVSVPLLSLQR
jgi:hypothetical protein